ncbi:MAG: GNAT family N-acetyltransferase [Phenylobacterium sp.]|uniref:GNAT family N-acetyltransferase n=1 Tax=Phenylobacterium sp. TaxID=1871053 RepID=UPI002A370557|nr:GNAT family N-acetyltransferase [Phenylobacterium sp.]MDX9998687.1 GNAT family N-acetyltransferase [Phenylobacterium sp.]
MNRGYAAWPAGRAEAGSVVLRPIRREDLEPIRLWRNAQLEVLRQAAPLLQEDQARYWDEVLAPSLSEPRPRQILVAALQGGALAAYGGLVHIDWESAGAEVSFLAPAETAADIPRYSALFADYLAALKQLAFDQLGFHRLFTETYDLRPHHVAVLEAAGFAPEGRMIDHVRIGGRFVDSLLHGCVKDRD